MPESAWNNPAILGVLFAGGVTLIGAVAAGIVSIITAWRTVATKVSVIEGHVNSEKTALEGRIATKDEQIRLLREMVEKKSTVELVAHAAASRSARATDAIGGAKSEELLGRIDSKSGTIAENTKKTADTVEALKDAR